MQYHEISYFHVTIFLYDFGMSLLVFNLEDKRFRFVLDYCVNILMVQSTIQVEKNRMEH